jgi:hypothetical protein
MRNFSSYLYENWNFSGIIPPKYSEYCDANLGYEKIGQKNISFEVYPNPVNEELNLSSNLQNSLNASIKLYTIDGLEIIKDKKVDLPAKIDISFLQKGIYIIVVNNGQFIKFIKE